MTIRRHSVSADSMTTNKDMQFLYTIFFLFFIFKHKIVSDWADARISQIVLQKNSISRNERKGGENLVTLSLQDKYFLKQIIETFK